MPGERDEGGHTLDDLARLQAEGVLEVHQPGTPEHAAARRAIRDELAYADAEALALEGPDALTSTRLLRQAAIGAELDPERYGSVFATFCARHGWERADLASYLGVTADKLAAMALELLPRQEWQGGVVATIGTPLGILARRYAVDVDRLVSVLTGS